MPHTNIDLTTVSRQNLREALGKDWTREEVEEIMAVRTFCGEGISLMPQN